MTKRLFLEERVSLARRALDEKIIQYKDLMPEVQRPEFHQMICDIIHILDGFDDGAVDARKRLGLLTKPSRDNVADILLAAFDGIDLE